MGTKLEQFRAVEQMSGITPPELKLPQVDVTIEYLLQLFYDMKHEKGVPITYSEMMAYTTLMEIKLEPQEVEVVKRIDAIFEKHLR